MSFKVYNTNGTNITGEIDVDTTSGGCTHFSVDVKAFNNTDFVIAWFDDNNDNLNFSIS